MREGWGGKMKIGAVEDALVLLKQCAAHLDMFTRRSPRSIRVSSLCVDENRVFVTLTPLPLPPGHVYA